MMAQPWEPGLARLEGSYEQIDKRLGDLRQDLGALRQEMREEIGGVHQQIGGLRQEMREEIGGVHQQIGGLRQEMHGNFKSLVGWMMGQTVAIIAAVIAVALVLHR